MIKLITILQEIEIDPTSSQMKEIKERIWQWYDEAEQSDEEFTGWLKDYLKQFRIPNEFKKGNFKLIWKNYLNMVEGGEDSGDWDYFNITYNWIIKGDN